MSAVLDILLIVVVLIFLIVGAKKGLVKSVSGFLVYILAFSFANYFYTFVMKFMDRIGFIAGMKVAEAAEAAGEILGEESGFIERISRIGSSIFSGGFLSADTAALNPEALTDTQNLLNYLIGDAISALFSFLALFIVLLLLLKLIAYLLNELFTKVAGLKQVNSLLGGVFGAVCGFFWAWVFAKVFVSFLFPLLNGKYPLVFPAEMVESRVVTFCLSVNPLAFLMVFANRFAGLFRKG